jgi:hypothetical protein
MLKEMPRGIGIATRWTPILWVALALGLSLTAWAGDSFSAGPLYDQFSLTLDAGERTEAAGPFFFSQEKDTEQSWGLPPFFSCRKDPVTESAGYDFIYPLLTYEIYGKEYRWEIGELFSFAGSQNQTNVSAKRFTIFPLYFQQRSPISNDNYTAVVPFYGHLKHRMFRDEVSFVMFPVYGESRKRDIVTDNYLYPLLHLRHGDGLYGWQFWPVVGSEHKDVTTTTNGFGETEIIPGHDQFFALWPLYLWQNNGIGTDDPEKFRASFPLYVISRSPQRDATSVLWPFFNWIDDRDKKYHEWEGPYPFVVVARGPGKTTTRFFPVFSRAHNDTLESDFYAWPIYGYKRVHDGALDWDRTRIFFYLFVDVKERNTETGKARRRMDLLPLFTWHKDFDGNRRLQILAPIEPVLPNNGGVERNWSPLWSLWRAEANPTTGATSQSLLWNLYRRDAAPDSKKCSLLFGLFRYQSDRKETKFRLFGLARYESDADSKEFRLSGLVRYQADENGKKLRLLHVPIFKEKRQEARSGK